MPEEKDPNAPNPVNNPFPKERKSPEKLPDEPNANPEPDEHLVKPEVQDPERQKED